MAGTERFIRVEEKLNAPKYRDSLNENPVQSIQNLRLGRRFIFQQCNDPKHTARVAYRQLCECLWVAQPEPGLPWTQSNNFGETWKCVSAPIQPDRAWEVKRWRGEWQIIAKCWCTKLVALYPKILEAVKVLQLSTELRVWILIQCTSVFYTFTKQLQFCFCFVIMAYGV